MDVKFCGSKLGVAASAMYFDDSIIAYISFTPDEGVARMTGLVTCTSLNVDYETGTATCCDINDKPITTYNFQLKGF